MEEVIEYEFVVSHDELFAQVVRGDVEGTWRSYRVASGTPGLAIIGFWAFAGAGLGITAALMSDFGNANPVTAIALGGSFGAAFGLIVARSQLSSSRLFKNLALERIVAQSAGVALLGVHRVRFDGHGVRIESDGHVASLWWDLIDRIYTTADHLFVETFEGAVLAIPRRVIGDEQEVERVVDALRKLAELNGDRKFALRNYIRQFECVCPKCGYALNEAGTIRCPECGRVAEERELMLQRGRPIGL